MVFFLNEDGWDWIRSSLVWWEMLICCCKQRECNVTLVSHYPSESFKPPLRFRNKIVAVNDFWHIWLIQVRMRNLAARHDAKNLSGKLFRGIVDDIILNLARPILRTKILTVYSWHVTAFACSRLPWKTGTATSATTSHVTTNLRTKWRLRWLDSNLFCLFPKSYGCFTVLTNTKRQSIASRGSSKITLCTRTPRLKICSWHGL